MAAMSVVQAWDHSLRAGDWETARSLLADGATYLGSEDLAADFNCQNADQIVDLMRSWKGKLPDVEVVEWETGEGDRVFTAGSQLDLEDAVDWLADWRPIP